MHPGKRQAVTLFGKWVVISGNNRSHLLPEFGRRLAGFPLKNSCKIGFLIVSQVITNFGNCFIRRKQEVLCLNEFPCFNDLGDTLLQDILTDQIEVAGGHE